MGIGAILGLIPTIVGAVKSVEQLLPNSSGTEKKKAASELVSKYIVVTNQFIGILHTVDGFIGNKLSDMDEELIGEWIDLVVRTLNRIGEFTHKDVA